LSTGLTKRKPRPCQTVSQTAHRLAHRLVLPRHLGRTIGGLIGTLSIRHVVLVGEMTAFGEPWLTAVRTLVHREAHRSALALLADETRIEIGRLESDIMPLGAAALLMTHELGLVPVR
jgi:predicted NBD/HSP70 family sugar kinase